MANELTWYTEPNHIVSDFSTAAKLAHSALWMIKALLKGEVGPETHGLWSCYSSCDSVTASVGTDLLGTVSFDDTKWVRAAAGSAHTWICLKSPSSPAMSNGPLYMIIDNSGSSDSVINVIFSKTAPSGGTTTNRPTASDEWTHIANTAFIEAAANSHKISLVKTADGQFIAYTVKTGTNIIANVWCCFVLLETLTSDLYPFVTCVGSYTAAGVNSSAGSFWPANSGSASPWKAQRWDGTVKLDIAPTFVSVCYSAPIETRQVNNGQNNQDSSYNDFPVWAYAIGGAASLGGKGRIPDLRHGPTVSGGAPFGGTNVASPPYQSIIVGNGVVLPWTGSTLITL